MAYPLTAEEIERMASEGVHPAAPPGRWARKKRVAPIMDAFKDDLPPPRPEFAGPATEDYQDWLGSGRRDPKWYHYALGTAAQMFGPPGVGEHIITGRNPRKGQRLGQLAEMEQDEAGRAHERRLREMTSAATMVQSGMTPESGRITFGENTFIPGAPEQPPPPTNLESTIAQTPLPSGLSPEEQVTERTKQKQALYQPRTPPVQRPGTFEGRAVATLPPGASLEELAAANQKFRPPPAVRQPTEASITREQKAKANRIVTEMIEAERKPPSHEALLHPQYGGPYGKPPEPSKTPINDVLKRIMKMSPADVGDPALYPIVIASLQALARREQLLQGNPLDGGFVERVEQLPPPR